MWPRIAILFRPLICTYWTKSLYSLGRNLVSASGGSERWLCASKIGNGTACRCDNWPIKSSLAICENTILTERLPQRFPKALAHLTLLHLAARRARIVGHFKQ